MKITGSHLELGGQRFPWEEIKLQFNEETWKLDILWNNGSKLHSLFFTCTDIEVSYLFAYAHVHPMSLLYPDTDKGIEDLQHHKFKLQGKHLTFLVRNFDFYMLFSRIITVIGLLCNQWCLLAFQLYNEYNACRAKRDTYSIDRMMFYKDRVIMNKMGATFVFTWDDINFIPDFRIKGEYYLGVTTPIGLHCVECDRHSMECLYGEYRKRTKKEGWFERYEIV